MVKTLSQIEILPYWNEKMSFIQLNELFNDYSRSLNVIKPRITDGFVCPICFREFGRDAITNRLLTREHVPPKKIWSSIATLTCKQCNNTVGSKLQNHMKRYVQLKEFSAGQVPKRGMPAQVEVNGRTWSTVITEVTGNTATGKRVFKSVSDPGHVPPKMWPTDPSVLMGKQAHVSLRLRYSMDAVNVSYLHSAYLALFHNMGYPYIAQPVLEPVRKKINSFSAQGEIPHRLNMPGIPLDSRNGKIEIGICWQTIDASCLMVLIAGDVVLMPFMNDSYVEIFEVFQEHINRIIEGKSSKLPIGFAPLIIHPMIRFSTGFRFEQAGPLDGIPALQIVPIDEEAREKG